jgi:hypothetical protein
MKRYALLLSFALLASACTSGPEGPPPKDPRAHERLARALTEASNPEDAVGAAIEALARAGVQTYDDGLEGVLTQVVGRPSPLRFVRYQVANLAAGAAGRAGILGERLDDLASPPRSEETPPFSAVLAGYVAVVDTFGAKLSRELMAGQDLTEPASLAFPELVLTLFVADVVPREKAAAAEAEGMGLGAAVLGGGGFCAELKGFYDKVATAVTGVINTLKGIPFLGTIITFLGDALSYPAQLLSDLVNSIPFFTYLKKAISLAGVLIMTASALKPWNLKLSAKPAAPHYQVEGDSAVNGAYKAEVMVGDPLAAVRPCAEIAQITLPDAKKAAGTPVTWTPAASFTEHMTETSRDAKIGSNNTALLKWHTGTESETAHQEGTDEQANPTVEIKVEQSFVELAKLADQLFGTNILIDLIKKILGPLVAQANTALEKILDLSGPSGAIAVALDYHSEPGYRWVMVDSLPQRTWTWTGTSCHGLTGPWNVDFQVVGGDVLAGTQGQSSTQYEVPPGEEIGQFKGKVNVHVVVSSLTANAIYKWKVKATPNEARTKMHLDIDESVISAYGSLSGLSGPRDAEMSVYEDC